MTSHARHRVCSWQSKSLGPPVLSAFQVWLWLLLFVFQNEFRLSRTGQPGYLDFDNLPETNFTCVGKVIGGYYADLEASCQMFHVCTIGQEREPMDIKFLCLNGTVFDQETRVCERVDEVDCSKSEKFYSLNLELYGNTAPPFIEPEHVNEEEEHTIEDNHYEDDDSEETDEDYHSHRSSTNKPSTTTSTTTMISTTYHELTTQLHYTSHSPVSDDEFDDQDGTQTSVDIPEDQVIRDSKKTSTENPLIRFPTPHQYHYIGDKAKQNIESTYSSNIKTSNYGAHDDFPKNSQTDSNKLTQSHHIVSPQEFIYQNSPINSNKPEAISFQQQTFPNNGHNSHLTVTTHNVNHKMNKNTPDNNKQSIIDKIYITSSSPDPEPHFSELEQIDKYELYESSKNHLQDRNQEQAHPVLSSQRQQNEPLHFSLGSPSRKPQGFQLSATTQNPHSQIQSPNLNLNFKANESFNKRRPLDRYQPSERHEIFDKRYELPTELSLQEDYDKFRYDRKINNDEKGNFNSANTQTPTSNLREWPSQRNSPKSPPRVIVTASASVSDSNGKKLNFTVGNVVHAVKPLVSVNYDDFKESDAIIDPFFLDVPRLKTKRSKRNIKKKINPSLQKRFKRNAIISVLNSINNTMNNTLNSTIENDKNVSKVNIDGLDFPQKKGFEKELTTKWTPPDYVDDNYEPHIYIDHVKNNETIKSSESKKPDQIIPLYLRLNATTPKTFTEFLKDLDKEYLKQVLNFHQKQKENSIKRLGFEIDTHKSNKPTESKNEAFSGMSINDSPSLTAKIANYSSKNMDINIQYATLKPLAKKVSHNYTLLAIKVSPEIKNSNESNFNCRDKVFYKFYADKFDCRTFHLCLPGFNKSQLLNIVHQCDQGTSFNSSLSNCSSSNKHDCRIT